jgi:hypothetical protein
MLWQACLPEGPLLAHATAALLGGKGANDPAPWLFGGVEFGTPLPAIDAKQQEEVAGLALAALMKALPRRGLAAFPETMLNIVSFGKKRLLIATPCGSPFVIFAWPAGSPTKISAGIRTLLDNWPKSAPLPQAPDALAELGDAGRLRPSGHAEVHPEVLLPPADTPLATTLLAQIVGIVGHLVEARIRNQPAPTPGTFVDRYLRVPATIRLAPDEITVAIPIDQINLDIRRTGLDHDPGCVPWLRRTVNLIFDGTIS